MGLRQSLIWWIRNSIDGSRNYGISGDTIITIHLFIYYYWLWNTNAYIELKSLILNFDIVLKMIQWEKYISEGGKLRYNWAQYTIVGYLIV